LLDEATSSLDSYAEARVQRAIDRLASGRLVISVAHRLSTLRSASRILVLENGRAVALGTHAELLACSPTFRRLWEAQRDGSSDRVNGARAADESDTADAEPHESEVPGW
jgi:ATP-binding cassette subfamily B protein